APGSSLLELDDAPPDLPVGRRDQGIHSARRSASGRLEEGADIPHKTRIARVTPGGRHHPVLSLPEGAAAGYRRRLPRIPLPTPPRGSLPHGESPVISERTSCRALRPRASITNRPGRARPGAQVRSALRTHVPM